MVSRKIIPRVILIYCTFNCVQGDEVGLVAIQSLSTAPLLSGSVGKSI